MATQCKILVVDDNEVNRTLFSRHIAELGHLPVVARDGLHALDLIQIEAPDLILLDVVMPRMDGYSLLKRLKANSKTRYIPVIMISGMDQMDHVVRCIEIGAEDYLFKPPNFSLLRARILVGLDRKKNHDQEIENARHMETFNLRLQDRVSAQEEEISKAYIDTLNRLVLAAELKDEDTGEHILRMSQYSALLATKLGLSADQVSNILYAAPLHDVGKIGVPDSILRKPGKLTDDEFSLMQKHPIIGSQILSNSQAEVIQVAQRIALTHHEKWNGKGYPRGLEAENIPLEGRIVALADTFDALTSKRPYKDPYPIEVTCDMIRAGRGTHFEPMIVDVFLQNVDEMLQIKAKSKGPNHAPSEKFQLSERDLAEKDHFSKTG